MLDPPTIQPALSIAKNRGTNVVALPFWFVSMFAGVGDWRFARGSMRSVYLRGVKLLSGRRKHCSFGVVSAIYEQRARVVGIDYSETTADVL